MKENTSFELTKLQAIEKQPGVIGFTNVDGNKVTLIATAHVSKKSVELVERVIKEKKPDKIAIELDNRRLKSITENSIKQVDLKEVLKSGQGYFFLAMILLSFYQRQVAKKTGSEPGGEMKMGVRLAREMNKELLLIDRPIEITLKRIVSSMGFFRKIKGVLALFTFDIDHYNEKEEDGKDKKAIDKKTRRGKVSSEEEVSGEDEVSGEEEDSSTNMTDRLIAEVEKMQEEGNLISMRKSLRKKFPEVARTLLDERDAFMVKNILENFSPNKKEHIVAVVGAAHVGGMVNALFGSPIVQESNSELLQIKKNKNFFKIFSYGFIAFVISLFVWGFVSGGYSELKEGIFAWMLLNSVMGGIGALAALAHPLTILSAILLSPFTSLNPALPLGVVCGLVEVMMRPPRMKDFDDLQKATSVFKEWWKNRLLRVLLVFVLTNLGSAAGAWIALPSIIALFTDVF